MNRTEINNTFKWVNGHKMTINDFIRAMEYSENPAINNMAWAMKHAIATGRLPNWKRVGCDKFFTHKDNTQMSNVQARSAIVTAILTQDEHTTAAGVKALQSAFGIVVK